MDGWKVAEQTLARQVNQIGSHCSEDRGAKPIKYGLILPIFSPILTYNLDFANLSNRSTYLINWLIPGLSSILLLYRNCVTQGPFVLQILEQYKILSI